MVGARTRWLGTLGDHGDWARRHWPEHHVRTSQANTSTTTTDDHWPATTQPITVMMMHTQELDSKLDDRNNSKWSMDYGRKTQDTNHTNPALLHRATTTSQHSNHPRMRACTHYRDGARMDGQRRAQWQEHSAQS